MDKMQRSEETSRHGEDVRRHAGTSKGPGLDWMQTFHGGQNIKTILGDAEQTLSPVAWAFKWNRMDQAIHIESVQNLPVAVDLQKCVVPRQATWLCQEKTSRRIKPYDKATM